MAEQPHGTVRIGELNLRFPSASAEQGREVAQAVVEGLADRLPASLGRNIGALQIQIVQPDGVANLGETIARAIARAVTGRRALRQPGVHAKGPGDDDSRV